MHDSYTPLGGLVPMWLMQLGEVIFGGVGSGLYGMLVFAIIAVFVAGLMVGRTPEYLGKKIEAFEMKMASLVILVPPVVVLVGTAVAVMLPQGRSQPSRTPARTASREILYAFSSAGNNNGSAFAGPRAPTRPSTTPPSASRCSFARYWLIDPGARDRRLAGGEEARAGRRRARCRRTRRSSSCCWSASVLLVGALTFVPALALGPIVEHLHAVSERNSVNTTMTATHHQALDPRLGISSAARRCGEALVDSFRKLSPRDQVRNPVMFVVYVGSDPDDDPLLPGARRQGRGVAGLHPARSRCGSGSRCCSRTSPRRWPRAAARRRPTRCAARGAR